MVKVERLTDRAAGFGIPGVTVDGYDVLAVYDTTCQAVAHARSGGGPTFIEAMTYRLVGHMIGDTEPYRTKEEVARWRERDPLRTFPVRLVDELGVSQAEVEQAQAEVTAQMGEIVRFALDSPWPSPDEVTEHVFA
jgi:pyruvate dehydrogenase E1 component alpha subunit